MADGPGPIKINNQNGVPQVPIVGLGASAATESSTRPSMQSTSFPYVIAFNCI